MGHQCCDQLTAIKTIKTGYPLTSITWPYRGLMCRPIEVEYFFEVIRWQVTSFRIITGLKKNHMKYVVFMSLWLRTIKRLISNWPRTRKFSQLIKNTGREKTFSYHGHALVTLYVQFLCSHWSKCDRWVYADNLCSILKLDASEGLKVSSDSGLTW